MSFSPHHFTTDMYYLLNVKSLLYIIFSLFLILEHLYFKSHANVPYVHNRSLFFHNVKRPLTFLKFQCMKEEKKHDEQGRL